MKRISMMSKKMRVFSMILLGVFVCFSSFTLVFYSSIREMRRNYQEAVQNGEVTPLSENAQAENTQTGNARENSSAQSEATAYYFRSEDIRLDRYNRYGKDMGFSSAEAYERGASAVINDPVALSKIDQDNGDWLFYVEESNELVIVSFDGVIKEYYYPAEGKVYFDSK